jgi:hypothetical protein
MDDGPARDDAGETDLYAVLNVARTVGGAACKAARRAQRAGGRRMALAGRAAVHGDGRRFDSRVVAVPQQEATNDSRRSVLTASPLRFPCSIHSALPLRLSLSAAPSPCPPFVQASDDEIKGSYRRLCITFHPDKHTNEQDKEAAQKQFQRINQAYEGD